jgi:hypothetical protein
VSSLEYNRAYSLAYGRAIRAGCSTTEACARGKAAANDPEKSPVLLPRGPRPKTPAEQRMIARKHARLAETMKDAAAARAAAGFTQPGPQPRPSEKMLLEAERIRNTYHPTIIGELMGDPKPGRSALDRRR